MDNDDKIMDKIAKQLYDMQTQSSKMMTDEWIVGFMDDWV